MWGSVGFCYLSVNRKAIKKSEQNPCPLDGVRCVWAMRRMQAIPSADVLLSQCVCVCVCGVFPWISCPLHLSLRSLVSIIFFPSHSFKFSIICKFRQKNVFSVKLHVLEHCGYSKSLDSVNRLHEIDAYKKKDASFSIIKLYDLRCRETLVY